jgi:tetratricopeptide (TPR) repeat protein
MERPDSVKRIPSLSSLKIKKNKYYLTQEDTISYTGNFIETYLNGAKRLFGTIEKGEINGYTSEFFPDGTLRYSVYYKHNRQDGILEEYFPNSLLKRRGEMLNGKMHGVWREWYSSGQLKEVIQYSMGNALYIMGGSDFYVFYDRAKANIESKHYGEALNSINRCLQIDPNIDYIYTTKGTIYYLQNKFAKAIEAYTKAIELEPMESAPYVGRATATMRLIEENATTPGKLKKLETLKSTICEDYLKAIQLGERNIAEGAAMRAYCL